MKNSIRLNLHFRVKVTLVLIVAMVSILLVSNLVLYRFTLNAQFESIRDRLKIIAQTAALIVDVDRLQEIPLQRNGIYSSAYESVVRTTKKIKDANPQISYLYAMTKTDQPGIWQFIFDVDTTPWGFKQQRSGVHLKVLSFPGDRYKASRFPEMLKGFDGPTADTKLEVDEWGTTLSGYAPIRNHAGQAIAVIGIDIAADDIHAMIAGYHRRTLWVVLCGVVLSFLLAIPITRPIVAPVQRLVEAIQRLGRGNLMYRVAVTGNDELSALAASFNQMARALYKSRRRVLRYFHNTIMTLIRVLEARDHYTRGHSEEVSRYAGKIALRLGFSRSDVKLLKKMTILHDIGKVGIGDTILMKREPLTEEEWQEIRKHPVMGEEILKPVLGDEKFFGLVRSHHERHDGTGYPDRLAGDHIDIFSAIVAVADSYHAMTSDRPYRKALNKQEAIEELRKCKGLQFHPKIVDVFLDILSQEKEV